MKPVGAFCGSYSSCLEPVAHCVSSRLRSASRRRQPLKEPPSTKPCTTSRTCVCCLSSMHHLAHSPADHTSVHSRRRKVPTRSTNPGPTHCPGFLSTVDEYAPRPDRAFLCRLPRHAPSSIFNAHHPLQNLASSQSETTLLSSLKQPSPCRKP
jgi:hypothetical protein